MQAHPPASGRTRLAIRGDAWLIDDRPTYPGAAAEGLLLNLRTINAIAADDSPPAFDPEANTGRFIARMPAYVAAGVRAFTIGLQGGSVGYKSAAVSGYGATGQLKPDFLARLERVVRAADELGAVILVSCFYQLHDQRLRDEAAVRNGVVQTARWLRTCGFANVALEIANEYGHAGFDHAILKSPEGIAELIAFARREWPGGLVSASPRGHGRVDEAVARASDFVTLHFNHVPVAEIAGRVEAARAYGKPVVCNEDAKIGAEAAAALRASVAAGCGWGFMDFDGNQTRPFTFEGELDDSAVYAEFRRLSTPEAPGGTASLSATNEPAQAGASTASRATARNPSTEAYFPPPESRGGWRVLNDRRELQARGLDADVLEALAAWNLSIQFELPKSPTPIGFAVVHRGWLVHEAYGPDGRARPTWIASIGKSITSCAVGNWIEAGRRDAGRPRLELESRVYEPQWLPEGFPLSDPRKAEVTLFHLLSHTSGIQPEPDTRRGEGFDFVTYTVGHCAAFPESAELAFDPGTSYGYSSVAYNHVALMAPHVIGRPLHESVERELLGPIGVESLAWRVAGDPVSQNDRAANYVTAAGGPFLTVRDLARYAYLHLHDGLWDGRRIVPRWYLRAARQVWRINADQPDDYGLGMLTNHEGGLSSDLPRDAYAFFGSGLNLALVVPSWELIVARTSRLWTMTRAEYLAALGRRLAALFR